MSPTRPAFVIGNITIRDAALWTAYRDQVPATLVPWQGEIVVRGERFAALCGSLPYEHTVVIRFPDTAAVEGWYGSAAYQALLPLREQAADVCLVGYAIGSANGP